MFNFIKKLIGNVDRLFIVPVLPNISDSFAFKKKSEKKDYYEAYGPFANKPTEKITAIKALIIFLKSISFFILFWLFLTLVFYIFRWLKIG